ncbi:MAG: LysE family transporter [Alphaproteobacteria bacterium]|nr:LysE family transporter [Alphaproteobacteria bacterium]MBU0798005.1 LysE family transporter [Alphaproteobacteria bacterium]MBU0886219.1 LysE family transporter [Alphaproteobacteria bacterium]MBU1814196.1 LysE family transporter [Alphaproteobacteria bacterium]
MNTTLILASVFGIFIPALMLPGPDFIAVVRASMTRGAAAGLMTTIGVTLGLGFYASLSLIGLSALLVEYQWLAWTVRVLGGCYLIYLGIRLFLASRGTPEEIVIEANRPRGNPLVFGFLVTLTNPKAIVLFASVFAPAVTQATPLWLMALMIALVMASSFLWYAIVSLFMSSAPVMRRFRNAQHWIERLAGVCFVAIGGRILADARNPVTP